MALARMLETGEAGDTAERVWLITGATGFLGGHVLDTLRSRADPGVRVVAMGRRRPAGWPEQGFLEVDLVDPWSVACAVRTARPDVVIHLAGRTPPASPMELYYANTVATALLLGALGECGRPARVVLAGSAAELGPLDPSELPADETHACRPADAYGLSKLLATTAGLAAPPPVEAMVGRIFNMVGPGTPENQALGRFALRLADPSPGVLTVGCLETRRDFIDVRDAARALIALALHGRPGTLYHIGTGHTRRVGEGLEALLGLSESRVRVETDAGRAASPGVHESRADIRRIVEHTGWRPEVSWEQSLRDLWAEVRARPRLPLTA